MKKIVIRIIGIILFPLYFGYKDKEINEFINMDMARYSDEKNSYFKLIGLLISRHAFRSVAYYRFVKHKWIRILIKVFFKPVQSIEICGEIGGGLYIPHNFVVISVYKAGKNLSVLPGTVIGKKGTGSREIVNPTIGDNCLISANSTIFGGIHIGNDVKIGAGSVLFQDVCDNSVVVGNPARNINIV